MELTFQRVESYYWCRPDLSKVALIKYWFKESQVLCDVASERQLEPLLSM